METIRYFHLPSISESLGNGWYVMKKYFLWLLLVVIICSIFESPTKFNFKMDHLPDFNGGFSNLKGLIPIAVGGVAALFILAFSLLVRPVISYGSKLIFLQGVRDQEPDIKLLFTGFQKKYLNIVLSNFLKTIILVAGFILLIIPGIVFACRLAFVPYLVMDKNLDPVAAVERSWNMTRGYGWTIFGLALMSLPIFIAGLICLIVGVFPAMVWISSSFASLYQAVSFIKEKEFGQLIDPAI
jgi:hypothetical protein